MRSRAHWTLPSVLAFASGCASIVGFEEIEFSSDATTDAGSEAATSDAPDDRDALSDVIVSVDAGRDRAVPIGCTNGAHDFCEDFEDPLVFDDAGWTRQEQTTPGTVARDLGELTVDLQNPDSGTVGFLGLTLDRPYEKQVSGARKNVSLQWRMFIEKCPPLATHMRMNVAPFDARHYIAMLIGELDGACTARLEALDFPVDAGPPGYVYYPQLRVPAAAGQWHDVSFDLAQAADGTVTTALRIDDAAPTTIVFPSESSRERFGVFLGMAPGFPQAGRVRIDDVRVDYLK